MVSRKWIGAAAAALTLLALQSAGSGQGLLGQMQDEVAGIVNRARPSIVSIEDERAPGDDRGRRAEGAHRPAESGKPDAEHRPQGDARRRPAFEPPRVGSGFSIGDGFIVTSADVISGMKSPMVMTEDGRRIRATVSGVDQEMNIGVLKLASRTSIPALKLGQSRHVYPGHFAISIGNQYGHLNSVALTLVAGIRDDGIPAGEHFYPGLIQIAGTVGVGTSGAPILNVRGDVIGMIAGIPFGDWTSSPFFGAPRSNGGPRSPAAAGAPPPGVINAGVLETPQTGDTGGAKPANPSGTQPDPRVFFLRPPVTSAGFAVPIDDMKPVIAGLRQGRLVHCWLGVDMKEERKREESDGIVRWKRTVQVSTVYPNSPASAAGIQTGDIMNSVNGRTVARMTLIRAALLRAQPGDAMDLRLERKGSALNVSARLAERPDQPAETTAGKH